MRFGKSEGSIVPRHIKKLLVRGKKRRLHRSFAVRHFRPALELLEGRLVLAGALTEFTDPHPANDNDFGATILPLSTGNVVITAPKDDAGGIDAGAVYLFDGETGDLISTLIGSSPNDHIGSDGVTALQNGNYLIRSSNWDSDSAPDVGALTFGNGVTGIQGVVGEDNSLIGQSTGDSAGQELVLLGNGNYLVSSPNWDNSLEANAGAVTFGDANTPVSGGIGSDNSLVGSSAQDSSQRQIIVLPNDNYLVASPNWDNGDGQNAGAVTFGSGTLGVTGPIGIENSLVGFTDADEVGQNVKVLSNGNYVISTPHWDSFVAVDVGAVTFGDANAGVFGEISNENSLIGTSDDDRVGTTISELSNGNFVVGSPNWDSDEASDAGAVTFGSGIEGLFGLVSSENSLIGSSTGDLIGSGGVSSIGDGNYLVLSPSWSHESRPEAGAVTFGNGESGIQGNVTALNSLVGNANFSMLASKGVTVLRNGNYIISSGYADATGYISSLAVTFGSGSAPTIGTADVSNSLVGVSLDARIMTLANGNYLVVDTAWSSETAFGAGAITFGSGTEGIQGTVSAEISLVGGSSSDSIGANGVVELSNGNYVVRSSTWDRDGIIDAGAVTFGNGTEGTVGVVSVNNSLVGSSANDIVGYGEITALKNGNYLVSNWAWDNAGKSNVGAVTFGSGTSGVQGEISESNSLVGSSNGDFIGFDGHITELENGNFLVLSPDWDSGSATDAGAVTFGSGTTGVHGEINSTNSLVGNSTSDFVGSSDVIQLANGNYLIVSESWDNGDIENAGAVTLGNGETGVQGAVGIENSLVGSRKDDSVGGGGVVPLDNGNYVVVTPTWDQAQITDVGAVTFGNGVTGVRGEVSENNSVVGNTTNDQVGSGGVVSLPTGNYVVVSPKWDFGDLIDAGAITFGEGTTGVQGAITGTNSARGNSANTNLTSVVVDNANDAFYGSFLGEESGKVRVGSQIDGFALHAANDLFVVDEDSDETFLDVMANDKIVPEGPNVVINQVTQPQNGTVTIVGNGEQLSYEPPPNFSGLDTFTYTVSDGDDASTATVTVNVQSVNDAPIALDDATTISNEPGSHIFDVLSNDSIGPDSGETLTISDISTVAHGSLEILNNGTRVRYIVSDGFVGEVSFTYTISDGHGGSDSAVVTLQIVNSIAFAVATSSGLEEAAVTNLLVVLGAPSDGTVTVDYAVSGGSATGLGVDYTLASGTLTFAVGQSSQSIPLNVVDDGLTELDETVTVILSNPTHARLGGITSRTHTIIDDDAPPEVSAEIVDGVLRVGGTDTDDVINLRQTGGSVEILNHEQQIGVFSTGRFLSILVYAGGGTDRVDLSFDQSAVVTIPADIFGEDGDDVLIGGTGNDLVDGGSGLNELDGRGGTNTLIDNGKAVLRPTLLVVVHGFEGYRGEALDRGDGDWSAKYAKKVATALEDAGSPTTTLLIDWNSTTGSNTDATQSVADEIIQFLGEQHQTWDLFLFGHSRGAIFVQEVGRKLDMHSNLGHVQEILLDPTGANLFHDQMGEIGDLADAVFYDDEHALLPFGVTDGSSVVDGADYKPVRAEMRDNPTVALSDFQTAGGIVGAANSEYVQLAASALVAWSMGVEIAFESNPLVSIIAAALQSIVYHVEITPWYLNVSPHFAEDVANFIEAKPSANHSTTRATHISEWEQGTHYSIFNAGSAQYNTSWRDVLSAIINYYRYGVDLTVSVGQNYVDGFITLVRLAVFDGCALNLSTVAFCALSEPDKDNLDLALKRTQYLTDLFFTWARQISNKAFASLDDGLGRVIVRVLDELDTANADDPGELFKDAVETVFDELKRSTIQLLTGFLGKYFIGITITDLTITNGHVKIGASMPILGAFELEGTITDGTHYSLSAAIDTSLAGAKLSKVTLSQDGGRAGSMTVEASMPLLGSFSLNGTITNATHYRLSGTIDKTLLGASLKKVAIGRSGATAGSLVIDASMPLLGDFKLRGTITDPTHYSLGATINKSLLGATLSSVTLSRDGNTAGAVSIQASMPLLGSFTLKGIISDVSHYSLNASIDKTLLGAKLSNVTLARNGGTSGSLIIEASMPLLGSFTLKGSIADSKNYSLTADINKTLVGASLAKATFKRSGNDVGTIQLAASLPVLGSFTLEGTITDSTHYSFSADIDKSLLGASLSSVKLKRNGGTSGTLSIAASLPLLGSFTLKGTITDTRHYSLSADIDRSLLGASLTEITLSRSGSLGGTVSIAASMPLLGSFTLKGTITDSNHYSLSASLNKSLVGATLSEVTMKRSGSAGGAITIDASMPLLGSFTLTGSITDSKHYSLSASLDTSLLGVSLEKITLSRNGSNGGTLRIEADALGLGKLTLRGSISSRSSYYLKASLSEMDLGGATLYNIVLEDDQVSVSAWAPFIGRITLDFGIYRRNGGPRFARLGVSLDKDVGGFELSTLYLYSTGKFKVEASAPVIGTFWLEGPDLADLWKALREKLPKIDIDVPEVGGVAGQGIDVVSNGVQSLGRGLNGITAGLIVFFDINRNGVLDSHNDDLEDGPQNEPWTYANYQGEFLAQVPARFDKNGNGVLDDDDGQWVAVGGIYSATGVPAHTVRIAPGSWNMITPLSTLVQTLVNNHSLSTTQAANEVLRVMGLPDLDLARFDSLSEIMAGNPLGADVYKGHAWLTDTIAQISAVFAGSEEFTRQQWSLEIVSAIAELALSSKSALDFSDPATHESIIRIVERRNELSLAEDLVTSASTIIAATNAQFEAIEEESGVAFLEQAERIKYVSQGAVSEMLSQAAKGEIDIDTLVQANTSASLAEQIAAADILPSVLVPEDIVAEATGSGGANVSFTVSANDLSGQELQTDLSQVSGSLFPIGETVVSASATDSFGNTTSAQFRVHVVDTTPPQFEPDDLLVEATGPEGASLSLPKLLASDLVDPVPSVTYDAPANFYLFGTTTVAATAVDASGNQTHATFAITVQDTTPPEISVPANITVEANEPGGAVVQFDPPSAVDLVDMQPVILQDFESGFFPLGTTTVTVIATDSAGNTSLATFNITVVDTTPPAVENVPDQILEANSAGGANHLFVDVAAVDLADPNPVVTFDVDFFSLGTTVVTATATDASGNSASVSFSVTVVDTISPELTPPSETVFEATEAGGATVADWDTPVSDIADLNPTLSSDVSPGLLPLGTTMVTTTATDASGNVSTIAFPVTVVDTTPPVFEGLSDLIVTANVPDGAKVALSLPPVTDLVDPNPKIVFNTTSDLFPIGTTMVTVTATDDAGNSSRSSFAVTVVDPQGIAPISPAITFVSDARVEGTAIQIKGEAIGTIAGAVVEGLSYSWKAFRIGLSTPVSEADGIDQTEFSFIPDDNGSYRIKLTITDQNDDEFSTETSIEVGNLRPQIDLSYALTETETGTTIQVTSEAQDPSSADEEAGFDFKWLVSKDGQEFKTESNQTGAFTFSADVVGSYVISATITDKDGAEASAHKAISISAPQAADSHIEADEDTFVRAPLDASDADGDLLTYSIGEAPLHGSVIIGTDGTLLYSPNPDYHGEDTFTYQANDGHDFSPIAKVTIAVRPGNDAPLATDASLNIEHGRPATARASGSDIDGDSLTFRLVDDALHGTVVINELGEFTYTPDAGYSGDDSFTFRASDGVTDSNLGTVALTVAAAPAHPWQNSANSRDVNQDNSIVPIDVLIVINELNARRFSDPVSGRLIERTAEGTFFFDVNGDGFATPLDALNIINFLNSQSTGEGETRDHDNFVARCSEDGSIDTLSAKVDDRPQTSLITPVAIGRDVVDTQRRTLESQVKDWWSNLDPWHDSVAASVDCILDAIVTDVVRARAGRRQ